MQIPEIDRVGTDAYRAISSSVAMKLFLPKNAAEVRTHCDELQFNDGFWIHGHNFSAGHWWKRVRAIWIALEHGINDQFVWAYPIERADFQIVASGHRQNLEHVCQLVSAGTNLRAV